MGQTSPRWQLCLATQPVGGTALALLGRSSFKWSTEASDLSSEALGASAGAVGDSKRTNITI